MSALTAPIAITYRNPEAQPPVFLAGNFTNPEWKLQEMQSAIDDDGEHFFKARFLVEPGRDYQFKFKLGNDDAWVLDESKPIVTDETGNRNNLLKVPVEHDSGGNRLQAIEVITDDTCSPSTGVSRPPNTTAALPQKPAVRIKDAEADRISSTPIEQVAKTAAEVADTAEKLDAEESSTSPQVSVSGGESETEEDLKTPLFAHESFGAYEFVDDGLDHDSYGDHSQRHDSSSKTNDNTADDVDINDPTIEIFPSDKSSVLDTLRKIQSSTNEDQVSIDDLRLSSRPDSRRASVDSDDSVFSATSLSPVTSRRRENRLSTSSGRNRSLVSLGSIAEEPKAGGAEDDSNPPATFISPSRKELPFNRARSPIVDEGGALMMKTSRV